MKYVFFGTPRLAEIILDRLIKAGMPPVALVANPDRPVGRKKVVTPPLTKEVARKSGANIKILQPEKLDEGFIKELRVLDPDLFVVAAYAKIIPQSVLDIPRLGTLGVHPSLLPLYRGASPIQSVILHGEKKTGVSIYQMDSKIDHGAIFAQESCDAGSGMIGYKELEERLAELSAKLLTTAMPALEAGTAKAKAQDESKATFTKKFVAEDGFVNEIDLKEATMGNKKKAEEILFKINALNPEPGVWTIQNGQRVKLLEAIIQDEALKLSKIQKEGGKPQEL